MKNILKSLQLFILCLFLVSCGSDSNEIDNIMVYYKNPGVTTPIPEFCINSSFVDVENIRKKELNDNEFFNDFNDNLKKLKPIHKNPTVDSRVYMLVNYKNGKVDTLCIGEYKGICLNGVVMQDDEKFHKKIIEEIDFYDKEKYDKMYGEK